ncbi:MAG: hypothetical protein ACOX8R_05640 [Bacillota bacterium]|jgi:recombinational DNA repair protein (RecF pathway)
MLHCKNCGSVIVPGRIYLSSDGFYCHRCAEGVRSYLPLSFPGKRPEGRNDHVTM